jgi:hypothetical protein
VATSILSLLLVLSFQELLLASPAVFIFGGKQNKEGAAFTTQSRGNTI